MLAVLLVLSLAGPPEPQSDPSEQTHPIDPPRPERIEPIDPPPPKLVGPPPRRVRRCLPEVDPCVYTTSTRMLLGGLGGLTTGSALTLALLIGDRWRIGDPAMPLAAAGMVAMSAAMLGGMAAVFGGDGPTLPDRITPATVALTLGFAGTNVSDERAPPTLTVNIAPTYQLPNNRGRLRLLGSVGRRLGGQLERDPRPQTTEPDGSFTRALELRSVRFDLGLDLAVRLPYPLLRRSAWLGQLELRYKPMFWYASDTLTLGQVDRVNQRMMLTPLNLGLRWHLSPRQRFTFYMGPRWDVHGYGEPGSLSPGKPVLGPIYSESWFDLDIPISSPAGARRASTVGQLTLGYVHARTFGNGLDFGPVVGFFGQVRTSFTVRVRPRGSVIAYQFELGAQIGAGVNPYLRVGVALPDIGAQQ
jgi:hypothetical protein